MKTLMRRGAFGVLLVACTLAAVSTHTRAQQPADGVRKVLVKTPATYPTVAQSMNIRGIVKVEAQVAPNGTVKTVVVKGGHPILVQSAVTAVGHWKFEPSPRDTKELIEIKFDPQ
jgi:TonB family protein